MKFRHFVMGTLVLGFAWAGTLWLRQQRQQALEKQQISEARGVAQGLVEVLAQFHQKEGRYPKQLEDLIPRYLRELPKSQRHMHYEKIGRQYILWYVSKNVALFDDVDYYKPFDKAWRSISSVDLPNSDDEL